MKKCEKERLFYGILSACIFLLTSFTLWEFLYELCNIIGSIVEADPGRSLAQVKRMFPMLFTAIVFLYVGLWIFNAFKAENAEKRARIWKKNGFVTLFFGAVIIIYVIVGLISGEYEKLIEGFVSPLFPLDVMIGGALFAAAGVLSVKYGKKIEKDGSVIPFGSKESALSKSFGGIFKTVSYMCASCGFAACCYGCFTMDFGRGGVLFNAALLLNYFTAFAMAFAYRFVYWETEESKRNSVCVKSSAVFLIVNVCLFAFYLTTVQIWNEAPNINAYGIMPIDFTACFNAFPVVYGLNNIIAPLAALIFGLKEKKKGK